jgi:hypothetical protein
MTEEQHNTIRVKLEPAIPGEKLLKIRITPGFDAELSEMLEAEGYPTGKIREFSVGGDLATLAVRFAASPGVDLAGIAAVLSAFLRKNQHKSVSVSSGEQTANVQGFSDKKTRELLELVLKDVEIKQRELDASWARIQAETSARETPDDDGEGS